MPKIPDISVGIQMERSVLDSSAGILGITSGGGPLISVAIFRVTCHLRSGVFLFLKGRWEIQGGRVIFRPKFAFPFLTNPFFALIREFGKETKSDKAYSSWLARFNRKMSFLFPLVFPVISDRSVWHNGKHPVNVLKPQPKVITLANH